MALFLTLLFFFSVITTENLPIEALCFLCGSAGEEELLFCKSCCEPYHPFCLNPEELPMTSEAEVNWLCRKCIQCQVKSAFYLFGFIIQCSKYLRVFEKFAIGIDNCQKC